jgi:hypothetical protein
MESHTTICENTQGEDRYIVPPSLSWVGVLYRWLGGCLQRSRELAELRQLDYRDRQELGFTRVLDESKKRFWQN